MGGTADTSAVTHFTLAWLPRASTDRSSRPTSSSPRIWGPGQQERGSFYPRERPVLARHDSKGQSCKVAEVKAGAEGSGGGSWANICTGCTTSSPQLPAE